MRQVVLALLLLLPLVFAIPRRYDGDKVVRVRTSDPSVQQWFLDSYDVFRARHEDFDLHVTPTQFSLLKALNLDMDVLQDNLQELVDLEKRPFKPTNLDRNLTWFTEYHTYEQLKQWYRDAAASNPSANFIASIGKSHEGRDLFAFEFGTQGKPTIFIQSLQHAREWIGGAATNYLVWHLLTQDTSFLRDFFFVVVPVVNPDGYQYSWDRERLWRKNRRNNGGTFGVDLNRNWDSHWGQGGSSSLPSSDTYMGPSPASEPEVQAIVKFFMRYPNIIAGFDMHCYSQLILRPYGWKRGDAEHESQLFEAAKIMADGIQSVHGKKFDNIHSIELYTTTGTTSDWFYDDAVKSFLGHRIYAYTLELRPSSALPGFQLPPSEIIPSGEELIPAFHSFFRYAAASPIRT